MRWKAYDSHPMDSRVVELEDGICTACVSKWSKQGVEGVLVVKVFERHDQDSRYRDMGGVCETVSAKYGTGGGNQPLVAVALHENVRGEVRMSDVVPALTSPGGKPGQGNPVIAYGLHPFIANENSEKPHHGPDGDGFKKEQAFTLASMGVPKVAKCIAIQGNVIGRAEKNGPNGPGITEDGTCFTLTAVDEHAVAYRVPSNASNVMNSPNPETGIRKVDISPTLDTTGPDPTKAQGGIALSSRHEVRRLMPIECERLQGMPDNWTRIPYRGKPAEDCPDSPRYKAIGNSWAVPVIHWLGKRIDAAVKAAEPVSNDDDDWI